MHRACGNLRDGDVAGASGVRDAQRPQSVESVAIRGIAARGQACFVFSVESVGAFPMSILSGKQANRSGNP